MPQSTLNFEWNAEKAAVNLSKHGVSFEEAATSIADDFAYVITDEQHSEDEPREILIGYSYRHRLLFVSFVLRAPNLIRIVSARKANPKERRDYEENTRF